MTTAYTSLLGLALPVTGELSGVWGDTVNNSITTLLDSAIAGTQTITADTTLTTTTGSANTSRQAILLCSPASANITITAPAQSKIYTVINTSAVYTVKICGVGPTTGVTLAVSESAVVAWNGTDFIRISSNSATTGNFTVNGNLVVTGNTTLGDADTDTITQTASYVTGTQLKSAKTATNTLSLAAYDVDGTAYTDLITLTASNTPTLALTSTGVGTINNMSIGATTASTGAFTTLSATGNVTLGDATTDTVTVNGYMGVGGAASPSIGVRIQNTALTSTSQDGIQSAPVGTSAATTQVRAFSAQPSTAAAAFTCASVYGFRALNAVLGAGSTITNQYGFYVDDQTQGTNNYGITSLVSSGTNKYNIYASGTAANYFAGNVGIGTTSPVRLLQVSNTSGDSYIGIEASNANISGILFADPDDNNIGRLSYDHATDSLQSWTNNLERMRIDSSGNLQVQTGAVMPYAPAPASISTTATLTNANIRAQIINTTGTTYTVTMPLGTTLETLASWATTGIGYDFYIVNTASGTITLDATEVGVTSVGTMTIATGVSAQFRIRRTAANTFVVYRLG